MRRECENCGRLFASDPSFEDPGLCPGCYLVKHEPNTTLGELWAAEDAIRAGSVFRLSRVGTQSQLVP